MQDLARIAPALFVVLWATGFIGARYAMPHAEPFGFLAVRFAITFAIFAAIAWFAGAARLSRRETAHAFVAGVLMHGAYLGCVFWAIRHGMPAGLTALVIGLQPLVTAMLAGPALGERLTPRLVAGLAVGFVGVAIVLWPKLVAGAGGVTAANLATSIAAMIAMSAGTVWQKRFVAKADLITGAMWQYLGGTLPMLVLALAFETHRFDLTGELVFAMVWLVLVLSVGAVGLLMLLIRNGAMSRVASLFYLVPAVTAVMAYVLFGETLTLFQLAGMAVTTLGVALAMRQPDDGTRARASA